MLQIIENYLVIFVIPFFMGFGVRLLCRRAKRGYLISAVFLILAVIAWVAVFAIPLHGSELYGLRALQATSGAAGAMLAGLVIRLIKWFLSIRE